MSTRTIFMTGATGFLGGALLTEVGRRREDVRWVLLARAAAGVSAQERVRRSLARFTQGQAAWPERFQVVEGTLENLPDLRAFAITHAVHLAANTSFRSSATVWRVNHDGTRRLIDALGQLLPLERVVYVGTAMSCGVGPPGIVGEDDAVDLGAEHIVEYTRSKAAAERAVVTSGLPWIIARPSIVVGHTRLGVTPSASIYWTFRAIDLLGAIHWPGATRIDVVPVDWTAQALGALLLAPSLAHRTYHLSAGRDGAVDWDGIQAAFAGADGLAAKDGYAAADCPIEARMHDFTRLFGPCDPVRVAAALSLYFRFAALGRVFDNRRLLAEGVSPPPRFTDYLPSCVARGGRRPVAEQMADDD